MPTVLIVGSYRFHFYSNERGEPPHIHVDFDDNDAKFWLVPVSLARNKGIPVSELRKIERIIRENAELFIGRYHEFHGN